MTRELGPAEPCGPVYEAIVRGEAASQLVAGSLRDFVVIDSVATAHIEATAQEVEFSRLEVVEQIADRAVVLLDGGYRLAARYPDGAWAAQMQAVQGWAILERRGGVWRVVDLPEAGRSLVVSLASVEQREQSGDLELAVAYVRSAR